MGAFTRKMMIVAALCGIFGSMLTACDNSSSASDDETASSSSKNVTSSSSR